MSLNSRLATATAVALMSLLTGFARVSAAQNPVNQRFTTGGRDLVNMSFANAVVGDFPAGLQMLDGMMEIVDFNGQRMLRASSRSSFLLPLPEVLPADFTLEFDIVPKQCCNPEDLAIEGTRTINQGTGSANVLWHRDHLQVVGGGGHYDSKMPDALAASLPGVLTNVVLNVQGRSIKLYTNGRLNFSLDRAFVRGRMLRVFLGGQNDTDQAVYLARIRVVANGPPVGPVAANNAPPPTTGATPSTSPSALTRPPNAPPVVGSPTNTSQNQAGGPIPPPGGPTPTIVSNVTVTQGPNGPIVDWQHGATPGVYTVQRWKIDDASCCNNTSPASPPLTGPPWQDSPPPLSGTYVYRVTVTTNSGSASDQAQFQYLNTGGGTVVNPGAPSSGPRSVTPMPTTTTGGTANPAFTVTVTMGSAGPVVTWSSLTGATGYMASRRKIDDANCCTTTTGSRNYSASSPWQDQPLPVSGTYVYEVTAATPNGQVVAQTQFGFQQPGGSPASPPTTPGPGGQLPPNAGWYRVTITGFAATKGTVDDPRNADGTGDEVAVAAAVVLWDRNQQTARERRFSRSREFGDVGTGQFGTRIKAGTMSATGGIWGGNGNEVVPTAFSPTGGAFPPPSSDQLPLMVWEGVLTDGIDALLVVPSIWEIDGAPHGFTNYETNWKTSPVSTLFSTPAVTIQMTTPTITSFVTPRNNAVLIASALTSLFTAGLVGQFGFVSALINSRMDRPIGLASGGNVTDYQDRLMVVTREKLAALTPGMGIIVAVPFPEPNDAFLQGLYTVYLRVERIQ
jgi:hypothetical protein